MLSLSIVVIYESMPVNGGDPNMKDFFKTENFPLAKRRHTASQSHDDDDDDKNDKNSMEKRRRRRRRRRRHGRRRKHHGIGGLASNIVSNIFGGNDNEFENY